MAESPKKTFYETQVEIKTRSEQIYNQTLLSLNTEERFLNYFKDFHPASIEGFKQYYASRKAAWYEQSLNKFSFTLPTEVERHLNTAKGLLMHIYDKKIFNLLCQWYAGDMDLPGVECSDDILELLDNPFLNSIIEPITQAEFDCYYEYLALKGDFIAFFDDTEYSDSTVEYYLKIIHRWQNEVEDESEIIESSVNDYPDWYAYYDAYFGTGHLKDRHLIRLELELDYEYIWDCEIHPQSFNEEDKRKYIKPLSWRELRELKKTPGAIKAYWAERNKQHEDLNKNAPPLKFIHLSDDGVLDDLVNAIEPPDMVKKYKWYQEYQSQSNKKENIMDTISSLDDIKGQVPVQYAADWKDALNNAYNTYYLNTIYTLLKEVFAQYREAIESGKPYKFYENPPSRGTDEMKKRYMAARKFKGEPENFDFLKKENL